MLILIFFLALGAYIVHPCFDDQVYLREFRNHVTVFQSENYVKRPRLSPVDAGIIPYAQEQAYHGPGTF